MKTLKTLSIALTLIAATASAQSNISFAPLPDEIGAMDLIAGGVHHQVFGTPGSPFDAFILNQNPYLGNPATFAYLPFRSGALDASGLDSVFVPIFPGTHYSDIWLANMVWGPVNELTVQAFSADIYAWIPNACGAMSYDPTTGEVRLRGHGAPNTLVEIRVNGVVVASGISDASGNIALGTNVAGGAGDIDATYGGLPWLGAINN